MLINPCKGQLPTLPGTRILEDAMGIVGFVHVEPHNTLRAWTLQHLLAPVPRRALGGLRAKFVDNKGYVTFINQRDLEVLLGIGTPGNECIWTRDEYPDIGSHSWYGFCADPEDLLDDLQERELRLREQYGYSVLPSNLELTRRVHDSGSDTEELHALLWDMDVQTGYGPDTRLETIEQRWVRVQKEPLRWAHADT